MLGCGYVGDPMPPALNIPMRVIDLNAEQVGARMKLRFTIPDLTTEKLPVQHVTVELRGGDVAIPVTTRAPGVAEAEGPVVAEWLGREIAFMVRLQNAKGRYSGGRTSCFGRSFPPWRRLLGSPHSPPRAESP